MKKENYWFFMFILAAAIVVGSTMSLYTNFNDIFQQSKLQQQNSLPEKAENDSRSSVDKSKTSIIESPAAGQMLALNGTSSNQMVISDGEQEEINDMLEAMGSNDEDYTLRIKDFQKKNSLPVTGVMDTETLNLLINKVTLQKSAQHLNN